MDTVNRKKLKLKMVEQDFNITTLASKAGTSRTTLSNFFNGKNPSYELMKKLSKALSLTQEEAGSIFFDPDSRIA